MPKIMLKCTVKNPSKKGPKRHLEIQKSRKTSKSEIENWPKRGQKWTSKTALKNGPKNRRKNLPKIPQNRPQIDHKSPANRHRGEKRCPKLLSSERRKSKLKKESRN